MAEVTVTSAIQIGPVSWRIAWTASGTDTYYVWVNGALVGTTLEGSWTVQVGVGQVAAISVFDDAADFPAEWYPATATLRWQGRPGDVVYRVEYWTGSAWSAITQVLADARRIYHYETDTLADATAYTYRVVPVDAAGRDGTAREFTGVMCRYPDAVAVTVEWDSGELIIDEA